MPRSRGFLPYEGDSYPQSVQDQIDERAVRVPIVWTKNGVIESRVYPAKFVLDDDYDIIKARVVIGNHNANTHPDDGCPKGDSGSAVYIQIKKYDKTDENPVNIFPSDERLRVDRNTHKDTQWASDMNVTSLKEDEILRIAVSTSDGLSYPGEDLTVMLVLDPA